MKQYTFLLAMDPATWDDATPEQREAWRADHDWFHAFIDAHGSRDASEALADASTATTVRHRPGPDGSSRPAITDGPFVELTEQIGGFYVVSLPSLDVAIEAAGLLPDRYAIEIRPVIKV